MFNTSTRGRTDDSRIILLSALTTVKFRLFIVKQAKKKKVIIQLIDYKMKQNSIFLFKKRTHKLSIITDSQYAYCTLYILYSVIMVYIFYKLNNL